MISNTANVKAFTKDIDNFAMLMGLTPETVKKKMAFDLLNKITSLTPVKTGRARASWGISVGTASTEPGEPPTKKGEKIPLSRQQSRINTSGVGTWFIYNNLPYIQRLEEGWSQQAPIGMVDLALADLETEMFEAMGRL